MLTEAEFNSDPIVMIRLSLAFLFAIRAILIFILLILINLAIIIWVTVTFKFSYYFCFNPIGGPVYWYEVADGTDIEGKDFSIYFCTPKDVFFLTGRNYPITTT